MRYAYLKVESGQNGRWLLRGIETLFPARDYRGGRNVRTAVGSLEGLKPCTLVPGTSALRVRTAVGSLEGLKHYHRPTHCGR